MKNYWILRSSKLLVVLLLFSNLVYSQSTGEEDYYYFPIRPGQINYLSGTMGEVRSSHFHAAIDIKTGGVEGLPVYASADGYVSRIKVSTNGYGNVLYVQHPNSTTTVYAHLLTFRKDIEEYIRKAQYNNRSFDIELFPEKDELKVFRGKSIGLSGNSGSSGGPHLHFEIRDAQQRVLNPLHYGFNEVKDNIPPTVLKIALVPMDKNARINNQYKRFEYNLYRKQNQYYLSDPIEVYGKIGIQVLTYDLLNGSSNRNGVPYIDVVLDGNKKFTKDISVFSFYETRDILAYYDYEESVKDGQRFQKLYIDDGNNLSFLEADSDKGKLNIADLDEHQVDINLYDAYKNHSQINITLKGTQPAKKISAAGNLINSDYEYEVKRNNLLIYQKVSSDNDQVKIYANRLEFSLSPEYQVNETAVYLWDLNQGIPDSALVLNDIKHFDMEIMVPSNAEFSYYHDLMDLHFRHNALFDTLFLNIHYKEESENEIFTINDHTIPLRKHINVTLKPRKAYENKEKLAVYYVNRYGNYSYEGGKWIDDKISFSTRNLGDFTLLYDLNSPKITPVKINQDVLSFYISDDRSGISEFNAYVNGEWVLMNYDYKRSLIWSDKLDNTKPFQGQVVLKVIDNAGNIETYKTTL